MIITRTPVRITFFGGGTDYAEYYEKNGGKTLGATINQYTYVLLRRLAKLDPYRYRLVYSKSELCHSIDEIHQPVIRECLNLTGIQDPLEIHYIADLPSFSGLGTSSSFAVCLLHAIHAFMGDHRTKEEIAQEAHNVERIRLKELVGVQDQYTCAHGGLIRLDISRQGRVLPTTIRITPERLKQINDHLLMFYTGLKRHAHAVMPQQIHNTKNGTLDECLKEMAGLVDEGINILESDQEIAAFGELMDRGWALKKKFSTNISNELIDRMYSIAKQNGAIGGKIMGAGAGGFMLLFASPQHHEKLRLALQEHQSIDFQFENSGTQIMQLNVNGVTL